MVPSGRVHAACTAGSRAGASAGAPAWLGQPWSGHSTSASPNEAATPQRPAPLGFAGKAASRALRSSAVATATVTPLVVTIVMAIVMAIVVTIVLIIGTKRSAAFPNETRSVQRCSEVP